VHSTEKPKNAVAGEVKVLVTGDEPLNSPPPQFANFVAISHAGTEVQLEFIFLDLNTIATMALEKKGQDKPEKVRGQTVAKVVVPVANFLQLKDHLSTMFARLEEATHASNTEITQEAPNEGRRKVAAS
jgi:hypothetical protein